MVPSSDEEAEMKGDDEGQADNADVPMEEATKDGPESKKRKVAEMLESAHNVAKEQGVCMACGEIGHSMEDCPKDDAVKIASEA